MKVTNNPKSRRLLFLNHISLPLYTNINTKRETPRFDSLVDISYNVKKFSNHYFMGLHLKKQNAFDQIIRNYYGSALKNMTRVKETLEKRVEAELPLINV